MDKLCNRAIKLYDKRVPKFTIVIVMGNFGVSEGYFYLYSCYIYKIVRLLLTSNVWLVLILDVCSCLYEIPYIKGISRSVDYLLSFLIPDSVFRFRISAITRRFRSLAWTWVSLLHSLVFPATRVSTFFWTYSTCEYTRNDVHNCLNFRKTTALTFTSPPPSLTHDSNAPTTTRKGTLGLLTNLPEDACFQDVYWASTRGDVELSCIHLPLTHTFTRLIHTRYWDAHRRIYPYSAPTHLFTLIHTRYRDAHRRI
jgi:hypothetical protein